MKIKLITLILLCAVGVNAQTVKSINYKGNKKTKIEVLQKLVRLKVGQELDSLILNNDATILSRLPVCNKSRFFVEKNKDGDYHVTYTIEETNTIIPVTNFWTVNNGDFAYQIGVKEFNFLGENKQLGAFYRNNGFHSFSVSYSDPFLFNANTGLSLTLQSLTSLEPLFFDEGEANYRYTNTSIEALFFKRFSVSQTMNLGINLFQEEYEYLDGYQSKDIPTHLKENKLLLKTDYDYNKLVYSYQYVNGLRNLTSMQGAIPLDSSNRDFVMIWNDLFYYKKIKEKGNFATKLRLGVATNDDSPFAPFSLDNNLNIRGVGNIIDRGTAVAVLNTEYRHTVIDKNWFVLQTNVFVDAGNWRKGGGKLIDLLNKDTARLHGGLGLRFIHKKIYNAVIRLDYGKSLINTSIPGYDKQGLVFGVGQYF